MAHDSFGRPSGTTGTVTVPIGFGGGLADPMIGLVRLGLRDYDPAAGRFTARDPTMFSGSPFNLYAYGGSGPRRQRLYAVRRREPGRLPRRGGALWGFC
jgi:RHS repeat-associated protein